MFTAILIASVLAVVGTLVSVRLFQNQMPIVGALVVIATVTAGLVVMLNATTGGEVGESPRTTVSPTTA